jgi:hypothetical protein
MTAEPITDTIEPAPQYKAVPTPIVDTTEQDSVPRKRGRPPGSRNTTETSPQRRGRKPRSLAPQIGGALVMANLPLMMFAEHDALDTAEIEALAAALDAQAQSSPRFRRYLQTALEATSGGQLITVTGMIVARRLARHNIIPNQMDDALGKVLGSVPNVQMPDKEPEPVTDA